MDKIKRLVIWLVSNGVYCYCIWAGVIEGNPNAENIVMFMGILGFITSFLLMATKDSRKKVQEQGRKAPQWFMALMDSAIIGILVYYGWFWYAGLKVAEWLFIECAYTVEVKDED